MHVKAKQVAFLGLLAAMACVLIIFASLIESNTLFLLAAAAYLVGIAIREFGILLGTGYFVACVLLGLLLSPNKLYVLTYIGLSLYIVIIEAIYLLLFHRDKYQKILFIITKLIVFNILYIPVLIFFPQLLFSGGIGEKLVLILIVAGQLGWLIYDKAYEYFQTMVWGKFRNRVGLLH